MFTPLKHKRISEEIVEQIRDLIKDGRLKPGDRLPSEREMAANLKVSRPSLREALKTLEALGFIEIRQRRQIKIKSIADAAFFGPLARAVETDFDMLMQLLEVRKVLETWAASQACRNATDREIRQLEEIYHGLENDFRRHQLGVDADARFHLGIYQATHNMVLSHLMYSLFGLLWESQKVAREIIIEDHGNRRQLFAQHRTILDAIRRRDARKARSAVLTHLNFVARQLTKLKHVG